MDHRTKTRSRCGQPAATVVVVDGYDLVRGSVKRILEAGEYKVIEVPTLHEAPSVCALTLADAVIIEIAAPGELGLETIRQLRTQCPDAAVIAISADGQSYLDMAKAAGATDVLAKPFNDIDLIDAVTRGISPRQ